MFIVNLTVTVIFDIFDDSAVLLPRTNHVTIGRTVSKELKDVGVQEVTNGYGPSV